MQIIESWTDLSVYANLLAYKLVHFWDRTDKRGKWDGWFKATDEQIKMRCSKPTYVKARKELIDKGYIRYRRGRTGVPSRYRFMVNEINHYDKRD